MNYQISVSNNNSYIVCTVSVPVTLELARDYTRAMDELSRAQDIKRFLVDVRSVPNVISAAENYTFANEDMKNMDLQRDVRSAILVDPDDKSHDFVETVILNAGYIVRIFHEEAEAISWLEE